jgi:hypothetical protein
VGNAFNDHGLAWRKSSASNQGNCVEVAGAFESTDSDSAMGRILIRDTKDRGGAVLSFTISEWSAFLLGVHRGEFGVEQLLPAAEPRHR